MVRASVLSVCDPEARVVGLGLDAFDGLDRVRDVGVVDERAVPDRRASEGKRGRTSLFFQELDEFNITQLVEVPLQPPKSSMFLMYTFLFIQEWRESVRAEEVGPSSCSSNLQCTVVKGHALERGDPVEGHSGG